MAIYRALVSPIVQGERSNRAPILEVSMLDKASLVRYTFIYAHVCITDRHREPTRIHAKERQSGPAIVPLTSPLLANVVVFASGSESSQNAQ